ncbi:adenylate cyclase [Candidatus Sumerlaeota bacterium]|nr:adenylate cyclase [Candidatus Sumerlaeota bacterium]
MALEIERKFLVTKIRKIKLPKGDAIEQGYLSDGEPTVRVRTRGGRGYLTVKRALKKNEKWKKAIAREECECKIPLKDARALLKFSKWKLKKTRHCFPNGVELDVFRGRHRGLIVAEYESADGSAPAPIDGIEWREVTSDHRYSNSWIARNGIPPRGATKRKS